jgi:hypothetical protein
MSRLSHGRSTEQTGVYASPREPIALPRLQHARSMDEEITLSLLQ